MSETKSSEIVDLQRIKEMEEIAKYAEAAKDFSEAYHFAALVYFQTVSEQLTIGHCRDVIAKTSNEYVICAMVRNIVYTFLRNWENISNEIKSENFNYFFANGLMHFRKSSKIRMEMLTACAKLLKRSVFDEGACTFDLLATEFYILLTSADTESHKFMNDYLRIILNEFDMYWQYKGINLPFDFQFKAKIFFEEEGLRQIFCKILHIIPRLCIIVNIVHPTHYLSIAETILEMFQTIFSRNFGCHHFSKKHNAAINGPPKSWRTIFLWHEFVQFFYNVYGYFRGHPSHRLLAANCLIDVASISYVVQPDSQNSLECQSELSSDIPFVTPYEMFLSKLLSGFVWIYNDLGIMPEAYNFCLMIDIILSNHPINLLARAEASFPVFLSMILAVMELFARKLLSLGKEDEENTMNNKNNDNNIGPKNSALKWTCISGIQHLYKAWLIVLQNAENSTHLKDYVFNFGQLTVAIIKSFFNITLTEPFGKRDKVTVPFPDREIYKEILIKIGSFSSYYYDLVLPYVFKMLLVKFESFVSPQENTEANVENLNMWREDMHWILLFIGHILVEEDQDHNLVWQNRLITGYDNIVAGKNTDINAYKSFIEKCVNKPHQLTDPSEIDFVIKIIGYVFAWCFIEDELLGYHGGTAISIDLCATSLWCAKRFISAFGLHLQKKSDQKNHFVQVSQAICQTLVHFALQKSFRIFEFVPTERRICTEAAQLLGVLACQTKFETSKCQHLNFYLSTIQPKHTVARNLLIKSLIKIASLIDDTEKQQDLCNKILIPVRDEFLPIHAAKKEMKKIIDSFDCFCAIADAMEKCSAQFLFNYLKPVLEGCIELLSNYKRSKDIINAVLQFFKQLTKQAYLFCDNQNDILHLYDISFEIISIYGLGCMQKCSNTPDGKDKANDLNNLLEIFINILQKKSRPVDLLTGLTEFTAIRLNIVLNAWDLLCNIMKYEFLKVISLRRNFFRFLKCSTELMPEFVLKLSFENFLVILDYLQRGLQVDIEKSDLLNSTKGLFDQQVSINSAYAIANLGIYFAQNKQDELRAHNFSFLIESTFKICTSALWQEDALSMATSAAFYSLLCCNEDACKAYIKKLLSEQPNESVQQTLWPAFCTLISKNAENRLTKSEISNFQQRLKQFLEQAKDLLFID